MAFKSYTHCVDRTAYSNPDFGVEAALATLGAFLGNPIGATWAAINAIEKLLDYMLNKKLVCLDGDRCAVGRVVGFETVHDKPFPDNVDNDFSINLMLAPSSLAEFDGKSEIAGWTEAKAGVQGVLITEQSNMPEPRTPSNSSHYYPYTDHVSVSDAFLIDAVTTPTGEIIVPVLHLECEGSRINDLLHTLQDIESLGLGSGFCDVPIIGWLACFFARIFLSPIILASLSLAWFAASDGNPDDARVDPNGGELALGDMIVVTGRWVFDASHTGYNELHPVKTIQKIGARGSFFPELAADPATFVKDWCEGTSEVPPPDRDGPAGSPQSMTPAQQRTWDAQRQPENRWVLHPAIDACTPQQPPPTIR
jgi:hypothetical protein